jgi:uncharacterized protein YqeY
MLEDRLNQDLKQALLARDTLSVETLRGLKSAILYAKVAQGLSRDKPTPDAVFISVLQKEAKKREESAGLYMQGGREEKAAKELAEKVIIERYLPTPLDESRVRKLIDEVIEEVGEADLRMMGQIIGKVQAKAAGAAEGAVVARLVKERLQQ